MNRKILFAALGTTLVVGAACFLTVSSLRTKMTKRLEQGGILPPLELFSQGFALVPGRRIPLAAIQEEMSRRGLQPERDFYLGGAATCAEAAQLELAPTATHCLMLKREPDGPAVITWNDEGWIQDIFFGQPWVQSASLSLFPRLITQFFDGQPILQQDTPLGDIPLECLQAVTAIEDKDFLEHSGVSVTGTLRAVLRNIRAGGYAQGGSTITQQLVKNFFLTPKKTIKRKLEEQVLSVLLENQLNKDKILEMYLNVIYMGQSGSYQVRGFGSAAQHYFDKPVTQLDINECALLAAIINNPGRYSPFQHPDKAKERRDLVASKMVEASMITPDEAVSIGKAPLPNSSLAVKRPNAPYFVMAALKEFKDLGLTLEDGARLYTTLDPEVQNLLVDAAKKQLPLIEARIKTPSKQPLQTAIVAVDVSSGQVLALLGGRDFRSTQYNRAIDSRRQIGSIVKPFVYWTALKDKTPLTPVSDEPFEWKTGKQVWKPRNYDGKSLGTVPLFYALVNSLNISTAKLGQEVGLDEVGRTLTDAGIRDAIPRLPSLTLGAFELSPFTVAQAYLTLARLGRSAEVHTLLRVEDRHKEVMFARRLISEQVLDETQTAVLLGIMKHAFDTGTARSLAKAGFEGFAGKTGTTSDTKDAWFAGFNARILTVVWVGYDDNTAMGLTGASAALPLWAELGKSTREIYANEDFKWPQNVTIESVQREQIQSEFPSVKDLPETLDFVVKK